jgi:tRNA (cytidine32/uridine32-2'-O)-methyltransferase
MKTMGLSQLRLVQPKYFPHEQATALASDAVDVLENAQVYDDLKSAIADCHFVVGTSARKRYLDWPLLTAHEAANRVIEASAESVAIVFGREQSGLTNEELQSCHAHLQIPANPNYSSLNLASAVQVVAYEIFCASLSNRPEKKTEALATHAELELLLAHLEETLIDIEFLDPKNPRMLMPRLRRLFNRAELEQTEVNILRGILTHIVRSA